MAASMNIILFLSITLISFVCHTSGYSFEFMNGTSSYYHHDEQHFVDTHDMHDSGRRVLRSKKVISGLNKMKPPVMPGKSKMWKTCCDDSLVADPNAVGDISDYRFSIAYLPCLIYPNINNKNPFHHISLHPLFSLSRGFLSLCEY